MEENHQYLTCKFIDEKTNLQHEIKNQTTEILISLLNIVDHKLNWLDKSKKNLINILQPIINIIIKNSNFIRCKRSIYGEEQLDATHEIKPQNQRQFFFHAIIPARKSSQKYSLLNLF